MPFHRTALFICSLGACMSLTAVAAAQNDTDIFESKTWTDNLRFSFHGGIAYQFDADIDDGGGDFSIVRGSAGLSARMQLTEDISLSLRGDYQLDYYDFSSDGLGLGMDLWDDIHTVSLGAIFNFELSDDWEVFAGPVLQFSFEGGAQGGEAVTAGGVFGAAYRFSDTLTLGGGFGITTQIEDDARLFPVFIVNWQITERLALRNSALIGAGGRNGLELVYDLDNKWEAALGGGYSFNRFRIKGEGAFEDGVGEDSSIPIWARISYSCSKSFRVSFYGGVMAGGELRLESDDGDGIASSDYDPAPIVGISGTYRF